MDTNQNNPNQPPSDQNDQAAQRIKQQLEQMKTAAPAQQQSQPQQQQQPSQPAPQQPPQPQAPRPPQPQIENPGQPVAQPTPSAQTPASSPAPPAPPAPSAADQLATSAEMADMDGTPPSSGAAANPQRMALIFGATGIVILLVGIAAGFFLGQSFGGGSGQANEVMPTPDTQPATDEANTLPLQPEDDENLPISETTALVETFDAGDFVVSLPEPMDCGDACVFDDGTVFQVTSNGSSVMPVDMEELPVEMGGEDEMMPAVEDEDPSLSDDPATSGLAPDRLDQEVIDDTLVDDVSLPQSVPADEDQMMMDSEELPTGLMMPESGPSIDSWQYTVTRIDPANPVALPAGNVLTPTFIGDLGSLAMGQSLEYTDPATTEIFFFVREEDIEIDGYPAQVFSSGYTMYGTGQSMMAIFTDDQGITRVISFEWISDEYDGVFEDSLLTFIVTNGEGVTIEQLDQAENNALQMQDAQGAAESGSPIGIQTEPGVPEGPDSVNGQQPEDLAIPDELPDQFMR